MASPLSTGLITKAAVQGEYFTGLTGVFSNMSDAEQLGIQVATAVGCQTSDAGFEAGGREALQRYQLRKSLFEFRFFYKIVAASPLSQ